MVVDQSRRLRPVDPGETVTFSLDGQRFEGRRGEPLAAALLANGVRLVGRSFKYHRRRGVVAIGEAEPNALLQVGNGDRSTPNLPATQIRVYDGLQADSQNRFPSLQFDMGAINQLIAPFIPVGFYYKTFIGPGRQGWMLYEKSIRKAAGLGMAPEGADPDSYEQSHRHCDVLIVGSGPSGLAAARTAARAGARVLLVEADAELGGSLLSERVGDPTRIDGLPQREWLAEVRNELAGLDNVAVLTQTTLFGAYRHNWFAAIETRAQAGETSAQARQRLWKIRTREVIFAAGALERMMVFENNDLPGVMLASAVRDYAIRHGVAAGSSVAFVTNNDTGYRNALDARTAGINVVALLDTRTANDPYWAEQCQTAGLAVHTSAVVTRARGPAHVTGLVFTASGAKFTIPCDTIALSGGWTPTIHLHSQLQGGLTFRDTDGTFVPSGPGAARSVGACAGEFALDRALIDATRAAEQAANRCEHSAKATIPSVTAMPALSYALDWRQVTRIAGREDRALVDLQNDVTVKDIRLAIREGLEINEHLKRYCGIGMGTDQGKSGNLNALAIAADIRGIAPELVGLTRYRQPYTPVTLGAVAGMHRGSLFHAHRQLPLQDLHARAGAVFEASGAWSLPVAYPRPGEDAELASRREADQVFGGAAIIDLSADNKFEVNGTGSGALLDPLYFSPLPQDDARFINGVTLGANGAVTNITPLYRLTANRFLLTTTPSRGEGLGQSLDMSAQALDGPAYISDVSDAWASFLLVGDRASEVAAVWTKSTALPCKGWIVARPSLIVAHDTIGNHMAFRIMVPRSAATPFWSAMTSSGATPAGQRSLAMLQAAAHIPRIGFEADGTVGPLDLGWRSIPDKSFVGLRSVLRDSEDTKPRRQLVQLEGPIMPAGAQILDSSAKPKGYISSSYRMARGSILMLALLDDGRSLLGQSLDVVAAGKTSKVLIKPCNSPGDPA